MWRFLRVLLEVFIMLINNSFILIGLFDFRNEKGESGEKNEEKDRETTNDEKKDKKKEKRNEESKKKNQV